jgi:hypothetical protein
MGQREDRRAPPRLLELTFGTFIEFPYELDADVHTVQPEIAVTRSLNGTVETQPESFYSIIRLLMDGVTLKLKNQLELCYRRSLTQGFKVEYMDDPTRLFMLAGDVPWEQVRHLFPLLSSSYTMLNGGGHFKTGAIGVYSADPDNDTTNWVKNGDFQDTNPDGTPVDWTNGSVTNLCFESSAYFTQGGKLQRCAKAYARPGGFGSGGSVHQDIEMASALTALSAICISVKARADKNRAGDDIPVTIRIGPADTLAEYVDIGPFYPPMDWEKFRFRQAMSATQFPTSTDHTMRVRILYSGAETKGAVYLSELQIEHRNFCTGFVPNSSVRTSLTGSRPENESLRFLNPLAFASQLPDDIRQGRFAFVFDAWLQSNWDGVKAHMATNPLQYILQDSHESGVHIPAIQFFLDDDRKFNAQFELDDGFTFTLQSPTAHTIEFGTDMHVILTYEDSDGVIDGQATLYVDGVLVDQEGHDRVLSGIGDILVIGGNPPFASVGSNGNLDFQYVRLDFGYLDDSSEGYTVADYFDPDTPPSVEQLVFRSVLRPGQAQPCRLKDGVYNLDLGLMECR